MNRRNYEPACSGVVLYLGLKRRYEQLLHHNFVFSRDPHEEFDAIYRQRRAGPRSDLLRVCTGDNRSECRSRRRRSALRSGAHALPCDRITIGREMLPDYRRTILEKLRIHGRTGGPRGEHRVRVAPDARRHSSIAIMSERRDLRACQPWPILRRVQAGESQSRCHGLYLAGGAAHPGPGMPMVLMSGWIAADAADQDAGEPHKNRFERRLTQQRAPRWTRSCTVIERRRRRAIKRGEDFASSAELPEVSPFLSGASTGTFAVICDATSTLFEWPRIRCPL